MSFKENLKVKTTNPFFGTLMLVWIIHNWKLIYTSFNFEKGETLSNKISFIASYLEPKIFLSSLLVCILWTFGTLIISYSLVNLARLIVNFFDKVISPYVYQLTDKSTIVLKSDYLVLKNDRDHIELKYDQERDMRIKLQNEYERLENKYQTILSKEVEVKHIEPTNEEPINVSNNIMIRNFLNNRSLMNSLREVIDIVNSKDYFSDNDDIKLMMRYNIIEKGDKAPYGSEYTYRLTPFGIKLKEKWIESDLVN